MADNGTNDQSFADMAARALDDSYSPVTCGPENVFMKYSGGDSFYAKFKDALDYGAVYQEGPLMWYCSWNGTTYGPFVNRAEAMKKRMQAAVGDELASAIENLRGGIGSQVG